MTADDGIKGLLGKAFGPEPPLTLDRAEIFRRGRRRVRVRRLAASGGVAAAVVAVVLGAAALNNLGGDGPSQDLSPGQSTSTEQSPASVATSPEGAPTGPRLPLSTTLAAPPDQRAVQFTQALADAALIPAAVQVQDQGDGNRPLAFVSLGETYLAGANLVEPRGGGNLQILVSRANLKTPVTCADPTAKVISCSIVTDQGFPMTVATRRSDNGVVDYVVHGVRSDGTDILVTAGNGVRTRTGVTISGAQPPVEVEVLKRIAALPRLTFG